jgi:hypothetical protein
MEPLRAASEAADEGTAWVTVSEAASRLKLTPYGIKSRIRRGTLRARQGNDRRLLVGIPANLPTAAEDEVTNLPADRLNEQHQEMEAEVEYWRTVAQNAQIEAARFEERLAAAERREADLSATVSAERARGDRLEAALAETRRPWWERLIGAAKRR